MKEQMRRGLILSALGSHVKRKQEERWGLQNVPSITAQLFLQTCFNSAVRFHSQKDIPYKIKLKLSFIQILYFSVTNIKVLESTYLYLFILNIERDTNFIFLAMDRANMTCLIGSANKDLGLFS